MVVEEYRHIDIEEAEKAFDESVEELREILNSADEEEPLQKSMPGKRRLGKRRYSPKRKREILHSTYELCKSGEMDTVMASKIEGRLSRGVALDDTMRFALGLDEQEDIPVSLDAVNDSNLRKGFTIPNDFKLRERLKNEALKKSLNGEIDAFQLSKIVNQINGGRLSLEMGKLIGDFVDDDGEALSEVELLEKTLGVKVVSLEGDELLQKAGESSFADKASLFRGDGEGERNEVGERMHSYVDSKGEENKVSDSEVWAKVRRGVSKGAIDVNSISKLENHINKGGRLKNSFLKALFE